MARGLRALGLYGRRAAAGVLAHRDRLGVTAAQAEQIAYCIAWHIPDDAYCPDLTPVPLCLKDAHSLDRVRLGVGAFDPRYLRTDALRSQAVPNRAWDLADYTLMARPAVAWDAVRHYAQHLGLWPAHEWAAPC